MGVISFYNKFNRCIGSLLGGDLTDASLLVEGVEIPVHKCILAARSEYFKHLFIPKRDSRKTAYQNNGASGSQAIVEIGDTSPPNNQSIVEINDVTLPLADNVFELQNTKVEVVRALLDYFYKGEYDYNDSVGTHLLALELAHQFRLGDLEETLVENLVKSITLENFVQFYNLKMRYKNVKLEESCVCFLKENGEDIARGESFPKLTSVSLLSLLDEDFFTVAEIDIFRAVERWAGVNKPNKSTVKYIVKKIRLATISIEDLFDIVSTSKELPSIDIMEPIRSITKKDSASTNFRQQQPTQDPVSDLNVARSSLGAKVLSGSVTGADLISGSLGCTSHKVGGKPDCIAVKLDKTYLLNAMQILLDSNEGSYKYHVEVSVNEREWLKVVDHSNYLCRSYQFLRFDPRAVRFIRLTGTDEFLQIKSLEAMYTNKKCSLMQGVSVASANVVLASRGATITGGHSNPMDCIDGYGSTYAIVKDNSPLIITLGQPYWLSSLRMKVGSAVICYIIESSTDGVSWQPVGDPSKGDRGSAWRTVEFSRRVVLHFRITMKQIHPIFIVLYLGKNVKSRATLSATS